MIHESAWRPMTAPLPADDAVVVRRVETLAEYHECVAIQMETWGAGFSERVPAAILLVSQKLGGVCAAAFAPNGRMLGFVFGLTGVKDGEFAHWSDLLAVRVDARGHHVGERLKHYQRELVRAAGITTMYWTFDPLVARNAHLNLNRLGARAVEYVPNMYGDNTGSPLHGALATDRFVAAWDLTRDDAYHPASSPAGVVVNPIGPDGLPALDELPEAPAVRVTIPRDLEVQPAEHRRVWRAVTRKALLTYLGRGYAVVGFQRGDEHELPSYQLVRPASSQPR